MEIKTIKERLSIATVLEHYNLKPDRHHRLCCPFHPDKTPSLQIYPSTNTFCCFSSNCNAGTGDQIQFIELMEKCTRHEALIKAASLAGAEVITSKSNRIMQNESSSGEADLLAKEAVLTKWFSYYQKGLPKAKKAVDYLQNRCINHKLVEVAYNSGGLHGESKNHHLIQSMVKYGLLKERPAGGHHVWAKDCIIFPLKNKDNKIISLYGRSITNNEDQRHFYLKDREGLYPHYPNSRARKLILTESVIDAASLLQQPDIMHSYNVLALYGTNGLTEEHLEAELTSSLESYRLQRMEALQQKPETTPEMTAAQKQAALSELKKPDLLKRTSQLITLSGIVGEEQNALIAYMAYSTRKQMIPLHVMFLGSSGSGKTYLQEKISELIPREDTIEITQVTENAFYYFKQEELKHKLILIEDLDGALAVLYPLRELQTKRRISKTVTLKDSKGNLKTITLTVEGPVSVSGCTTKEKLYEDNANRCLLLYIDQTKEQDKRITEYQTMSSAGEVNKEREQQYKELFRNMQRLLRPVSIINPYAKHIQLPEQVFKPRRTMTLLLGFIEAITFYHQFQREVKRDSHGQLYIETTVADIEAAFNLLKDVLFSKSDELNKATRNFLEQVKAMLQQSGTESFNARQAREQLRLNPGNMKRYLSELMRYGYIKAGGNRYRGSYEYAVINMAEYEALKASIDQHLAGILAAIKDKVSSSVVH